MKGVWCQKKLSGVKGVWCKRLLVQKVSGVKKSGVKGVLRKRCLVSKLPGAKGGWYKKGSGVKATRSSKRNASP